MEQICFPLPEWLTGLGLNGTNSWKLILYAGICFWVGSQAASTGFGEFFTRASKKVSEAGPLWGWLAAILWVIGVIFGKLGFDTPHEVKKRAIEKAINGNTGGKEHGRRPRQQHPRRDREARASYQEALAVPNDLDLAYHGRRGVHPAGEYLDSG
jgi:hypothetical protein